MKRALLLLTTVLTASTSFASQIQCKGSTEFEGRPVTTTEFVHSNGAADSTQLNGRLPYNDLRVHQSKTDPKKVVMEVINNDGDLESSIEVTTQSLSSGITLVSDDVTFACVAGRK